VSVLSEILTDSGLSQAELARRAGMPRSVVNAYVRGKREPGADALGRLAAAGGFDLTLSPRRPPVDAERASRILVQVLELAEALPYSPKPELGFPRLPDRIAKGAQTA
jgi:transcriptional regulator with XRE-family HTH domain